MHIKKIDKLYKLNKKNRDLRRNIFMYSFRNNLEKVIKILDEKNIDQYEIDKIGNTIWHKFAENNNLEAIKIAINKYNFDQYTKNFDEEIIWHRLAYHKNLEAIKIAIDKYNFNQYTQNIYGTTIWCYFSGTNLEAIKTAIKKYNFNIYYLNNFRNVHLIEYNKNNKRLLIHFEKVLNENIIQYLYKLF